MPQLRLIIDAFTQLKQDDPDTAITLSALRRMVKAGDIPVVRVGRKSLINYGVLLQHLYGSRPNSDPALPEAFAEVRKIS